MEGYYVDNFMILTNENTVETIDSWNGCHINDNKIINIRFPFKQIGH